MIIPFTIYSQDWSSRIRIIERHLEDHKLIHDAPNFKHFPDIDNSSFSLLSFQGNTKNIKAGINMLIEEDLPESEISIQDFFIYSFGLLYMKNSFNFAFNIKNFMNLFNNNLSVEPALFSNKMVYLEHDVSSLITVSINYNF